MNEQIIQTKPEEHQIMSTESYGRNTVGLFQSMVTEFPWMESRNS